MTEELEIRFVAMDHAQKPTAVLIVESELAMGSGGKALDKQSKGQLVRASRVARFTSPIVASAAMLSGVSANRSVRAIARSLHDDA